MSSEDIDSVARRPQRRRAFYINDGGDYGCLKTRKRSNTKLVSFTLRVNEDVGG